jgi:biotin carboxyl carrier protein
LARQKLPKKFLNVDRIFGVYRGYKPSGLTDGAEGELKTAMPGKVIKLNVKEGDTVNQGDTLLILEAMKMENEIKASISGTIKSIMVEEGQALESGVLMIEIE